MMPSSKFGTRPPSTLRIAQCEPEATDLPHLGRGRHYRATDSPNAVVNGGRARLEPFARAAAASPADSAATTSVESGSAERSEIGPWQSTAVGLDLLLDGVLVLTN